MSRTLVQRTHNPAGSMCGCPPECFCQRSSVGRLLRWYVQGKYETPLGSEEKRRLAEVVDPIADGEPMLSSGRL
jgi:hypothetical protein